jgi:SAM-dependent methyltransferase
MSWGQTSALIIATDRQVCSMDDSHQDVLRTSGGNDGDNPQSQLLQAISQLQPGLAQQVAPAMQPDLDIDDEGYQETTSSSYVSSLASEVTRGVLENERIYPQYGKHSYGMPVDEDEMARMDLQHSKYALLLGDRHFLAPIGSEPQEILDLGTGTGIWALDMADMFPSARVLGVDIAPIQPLWVAPNCTFEIDDMEATWTYKPDHFDFIHLRDPLLSVRDWSKLLRQVMEHLKPGGWFEIACIYPTPTSDDGSMPADSGFKFICDKLVEAATLFQSPFKNTEYANMLREAGFDQVTEHIFKIPSSPWPKDPRLKKIGALEMTNVIAGSSAFALRLFEKTFGWSREQTEVALIAFKRDVKNRQHHQYCPSVHSHPSRLQADQKQILCCLWPEA